MAATVFAAKLSHSDPKPSPGKIAGVKTTCNGDRQEGFWIPVEVDPNDPIFGNQGKLAPVSALIGLPLLSRKCPSAASSSFDRKAMDNQVATYLMIEADSGFAAPVWQMNVGTVLFVRQDKKPLAVNHFEAMWMFNDRILDMFGDDDSKARAMMTNAKFVKFWDNYKYNEVNSGGRVTPERESWKITDSPFEV